MSSQGIVIAGAGQAGAWAARTLREEGYTGPVHLIGTEPYLPYERPPLSKDYLLGNLGEDDFLLLSAEEIKEMDISFYPSTGVEHIDRLNRKVRLAGGTELGYEQLLLATGGRAAKPDIQGIDAPHVFFLRSLDDAKRLRDYLGQGESRRVVVIGGGWIGLELAATCQQLAHQVTVLEWAPQLCQRSVDAPLAQALQELHQAHGNQVICGAQVQAIEPQGDYTEVVLNDGSRLAADCVIVSTGLQTNFELAHESGLETDAQGIMVDDFGRTNDPYIYAAGDVTVQPCPYFDAGRRHESWQNAQDQGVAVAKAMLGKGQAYRPLPRLWSEQFDLMFHLYGYVKDAQHCLVRGEAGKQALYLYLNDNDQIIGAVSWNATRDYRAARMLVDNQASIPLDTLADTTIPLMKIARGHHARK